MDKLIALARAEHTYDLNSLRLKFGAFGIEVRTDSALLRDALAHYFTPYVVPSLDRVDRVVEALDRAIDIPADGFSHWPREAGKIGQKEAVYDGEGFRLIWKVKTGVVFYQSPERAVAMGPCADNDNQIINFINVQYMSHLQYQGCEVCHAAAAQHGQRVLAFAGFSGGGKSTLMLHCLNDPSIDYLSNDRLLVKRSGANVQAYGIPKLPRINPGTLMNNQALVGLASEAQLARWGALSLTDLWQLEEKYDVFVEACFGPGRIQTEGRLDGLMILNWSHQSSAPTRIERVNLPERLDLLEAVMKSAGPMHLDPTGQPLPPLQPLIAEDYLAVFEGVSVFELSGGVDFERAQREAVAFMKGVV